MELAYLDRITLDIIKALNALLILKRTGYIDPEWLLKTEDVEDYNSIWDKNGKYRLGKVDYAILKDVFSEKEA